MNSLSLADASFRLFCSGFFVAAPIGPVAFLIFRYVLQNRFLLGLLTGCGAAVADGAMGFAALLGLEWVHTFFLLHEAACRTGGGFFLILLGVLLYCFPPRPKAHPFSENPLIAFGTGFFITILNPLTFTAFLAVFSILHISCVEPTGWIKGVLTGALFLGALTWWILLTFLARWGKSKLNLSEVARLNTWISIFLVGCGIATLVHTVVHYYQTIETWLTFS